MQSIISECNLLHSENTQGLNRLSLDEIKNEVILMPSSKILRSQKLDQTILIKSFLN